MSRNFWTSSGKKSHLNFYISCTRGFHRTHELPWGEWGDCFFALQQVQIAVHVGFCFRLLHILLLSLPSPNDIENSSASCFIYKFLWFCALSAWVGGRSSVLWIFNRKAENSSPQNLTLMVCNVSGTILLSGRQNIYFSGLRPELKQTFLWGGSSLNTTQDKRALQLWSHSNLRLTAFFHCWVCCVYWIRVKLLPSYSGVKDGRQISTLRASGSKETTTMQKKNIAYGGLRKYKSVQNFSLFLEEQL